MKYEEFANKMYTEFPKMFPVHRGFEINDGWYHIIEVLCNTIQGHIDWSNEQRDKYQRGEGCKQVIVIQVKEKFGGLRFYYVGGNEYIHGLVRMAEVWAANSCEVCGDLGSRRGTSWLTTLCNKHWSERENKS